VRSPATGELGPVRPGPPPDPPELPEGVDPTPRWPAWYAGAGFLMALSVTFLVVGTLAVVVGNTGDGESAGFVVAATFAQELIFVCTAIAFARMTARPRPWHFGLRPARLWQAVGWAALALVTFYVVSAIYAALFQPDVEQSITEDLGADQSTLGLIAAGVMVVGFAPFAEEFFFRGFFYRALRTRFGIMAAAAIDGLVFGVIHFDFSGADALLILPPLALLGFLFCLVYERTGSLYPVIALHAINNALAYGVQADGWAVSAVVLPIVLVACLIAPRLSGARRPAPSVQFPAR
jgi:membrane protease YdiL (CAAX protease family)